MHTRNVNVKTAAQESTEDVIQTSPLPSSRICFAGSLPQRKESHNRQFFTPPANATELTLINNDCPDYISVWVIEGRPVAAAMPLDNFHRVISSSLTN